MKPAALLMAERDAARGAEGAQRRPRAKARGRAPAAQAPPELSLDRAEGVTFLEKEFELEARAGIECRIRAHTERK
jgi:hypothetical protein